MRFAIAVFETQNRSPEKTLSFVMFSEFLTHPRVHHTSPKANASTKPKNVPFMEAELGSHVLHMYPIQWHDQYNMNKKGMTPIDMCLLLTSLEGIKPICTYEKGKPEFSKKTSKKGEKREKSPGTHSMARVPKKVCF